MSTAMICFASEQVWPNLQALVHWMRNEGGLTHLFIYHTNDEHFSKGPAFRLASFVAKLFPRLAIRTGGFSMTPSDVTQQVNAWIRDLPPNTKIILNVTCGNKLMTCGALFFAGHPRIQLIYREREGTWYTISGNVSDSPLSLREFSISPTCTDDLSPLDLLNLQMQIDPEMKWHADTVPSLPVLPITQKLVASRWDLLAAFKGLAVPKHRPFGYLFESYIAAIVRQFGVRSVVLNACLRPRVGNPLDEIDVLANSSSRLLFIECKWTRENAEPLLSQIERAAQRRRAFGGLAAHFLIIRPLKDLPPSHRQLASTIGVKVIDRASMPALIPTLATLLNRPVTPELASIQELLQRHRIPSPAQRAQKKKNEPKS